MGDLFYGAAPLRIRVDDVLLRHVKIVVEAKLRRREGFLLSWVDADAIDGGRNSVWVHSGTDLHFKFDGSRRGELDRGLVERLAAMAGSTGGLELSDPKLAFRPEP